MRPYLITAKPGRLRRAAAWSGRWALKLLALMVMCVLGGIVFAIRSTRPVINFLATRAAWVELWASSHTGIGPLGSILGATLTDEFIREYHKGRSRAAV
jgi:hypothetical protein